TPNSQLQTANSTWHLALPTWRCYSSPNARHCPRAGRVRGAHERAADTALVLCVLGGAALSRLRLHLAEPERHQRRARPQQERDGHEDEHVLARLPPLR